MKVTNIKWETYGRDIEIPKEFIIPATFIDEDGEVDYDAVADWISNETGWLHDGFEVVEEYIIATDERQSKELIEHLSMNGYHASMKDNLLFVSEDEKKQVETILEDRNISSVSHGPIREIDITKEDIRCCNDLLLEDGYINATYVLWFDVDKYFGWKTKECDGAWYNFYTDWHPDGSITASYTVDGEIYFHEEWELTEEEVEFFRNKMESYCQQTCGKSLEQLWSENVDLDTYFQNTMTKGQVMEKYGIKHISHCNPSEFSDENFEAFVKVLSEEFGSIPHIDIEEKDKAIQKLWEENL